MEALSRSLVAVKQVAVSAIDSWAVPFRWSLRIVGVVLVFAFVLPWGIGTDVPHPTNTRGNVMMAWEYASALDMIEEKVGQNAVGAKRMLERNHDSFGRRDRTQLGRMAQFEGFATPSSWYPSFLMAAGLVMAAFGFARTPRWVLVVAPWTMLVMLAMTGFGAPDVGDLINMLAAFSNESSERIHLMRAFFRGLDLIALGLLLIGSAGALRHVGSRVPAVRTAPLMVGAALMIGGMIQPINSSGQPMILWAGLLVAESFGLVARLSQEEFPVGIRLYFSLSHRAILSWGLALYLLGCLVAAASALVTAVRSPWGFAQYPCERLPGSRDAYFSSGAIALLAYTGIYQVAVFSAAMRGLFLGGIYLLTLRIAIIIWGISLLSFVLAAIGACVNSQHGGRGASSRDM